MINILQASSPITGKSRAPVLAMEMTSRPGERRFTAELLTLPDAPQRPRADYAQMEQPAMCNWHAASQPSVLTAKSLWRMLQMSEGITANLFHIVNTLAIEAIEIAHEKITNTAIERWQPEFDAKAAFA